MSEVTFVIVEYVKQDLEARAALGLKKYGVTLERDDLSDTEWLQHAYEEALDLACYLKRLITKRATKGDTND